MPQYFSHPDQFPDFTDHITNGYWKSDEAFTQRRLAGLCPLYMRKVVQQGLRFIKFIISRLVLIFLEEEIVLVREI